MNGTGHDNDSSRPIDSLDSFEHMEGVLNGQSDEDFESDLPFDVQPPEFQLNQDGLSQDELEDRGIVHGERLTNESLGGDIIHFEDEHETSGLLNESELLNHRDEQYDSGSNCPSEDFSGNEGGPLGQGSSTDLLQRYMETTPRADTSLPELNYASDGLSDDGSIGYSDDVSDHHEHFYNTNNMEDLPPGKSDQIRNYEMNVGSGINNLGRTPVDAEDASDEASTELNNTVIATDGRSAGNHSTAADEENYGDDPPDSKDSDSASMSIGQFVPNAVNRNRLPRPLGKPMKRSTPKHETDLAAPPDLNGSHRTSVGSRSARSSARNSPRVSATGSSHRSRNSPRYSQRSEDLSDRSRHKHSSLDGAGNRGRARSPVIPRLELHRTSIASSANLSPSSDLSKLDLSLRLQAESKTRQQADELIDQLQKNYDELLGKYARAENTIDQLKLGARVNLYGDSPTPGQIHQGAFSPAHKPGVVNFATPQKATFHHMSSSSRASQGQVAGQPNNQNGHSTVGMQTNNNNIEGPAGTRLTDTARTTDSGFPAGEGILMALAFKVKSQQEQIDSFGTLLQENQLAPTEQKTVLDRLRADQSKLEADYMQAKEEHNALRRRNSLLSGGAEGNFDPDRTLEGEIFQLGMKLEDVAEIVQNNLRNNPPTTLSPPHANQPQGLTNGNAELQEQLRQELERQFQNSRQAEERKSYTDGEDERDDPGVQLDHNGTNLPYHSGSPILPSGSEDEFPSPGNAPSLFSPPKAARPARAEGTERSSRNKVPADLANGQRRPKQGHLPRPTSLTNANKHPVRDTRRPSDIRQHANDSRGNDDAPRQKLPENGVMSPEADSGFMGSESSRQSNQNGGYSGYDGRNQLRKPRERHSLRSGKIPVGQRSPPQVNRRLPRDWESPQFSDYDISERDEDAEEASTRSGGAGQRKQSMIDKTPLVKSASQLNRRPTTDSLARQQPSGKQRPAEKQRDKPHSRGQQATERQRTNPERRTETKPLNDRSTAWDGYRDTSVAYPEPTSNYRPLPRQSLKDPFRRRDNPMEVSRMMADHAGRSRDRGLGKVQRERPRPVSHEQRGYDFESDVTRSSGKSEAIRGLQGEIERLKRQMAEMNTPEKSRRRCTTEEEPHHPRSSLRKSRLDSVGSDAGSGRSEILRALQNEIDDLRNQVNERDASPSMYGSPLSRMPLRDPLRDDRSHFDSQPPRDRLRETLRQTYIPQNIPQDPPFTKTPTRSFLPSRSPYQSGSHNPAPRYESTPFFNSSSYFPKASSFAESPSPAQQTYHPSRFQASTVKLPPDTGITPSPVYTTRLEPCPMCSGSGVHTHGAYSYPSDLHRHAAVIPPRTAQSTPHDANTQVGPVHYPVTNTNPNQPVYSPDPLQGQTQASMNTPQNQAPFSNPGQQSTFNPHQQVLNQHSVQNPQPVFSPQTVSKPVVTQPHPVFNQPQHVLNQPHPPLIQPQTMAHQPQPVQTQPQQVQTQPQQVQTQPQPLLNQPQAVLNQPQPATHPPAPTPLNQGLNQPISMQTPNPGQSQAVMTPVVANYVPLVTIPVYAGVPVNNTQQDTGEKQSKNRREKKLKKSSDSQKSSSGPQETGGTTIYITPTKRRGRYYVLDDEEADSTCMEEEFYFRRTPRGNSRGKVSSFTRKTKDSKYAQSSSVDLEEAIKMADRLNRSSHRMLETVRNDVSQSQFL